MQAKGIINNHFEVNIRVLNKIVSHIHSIDYNELDSIFNNVKYCGQSLTQKVNSIGGHVAT